jgi:uncharacterized cupredoxin-like copper-binding protein
MIVAGVALATSAAAWTAGSVSDDVRTVDVTIHHSSFSPARFEFAAGETVRFVVHNEDPIDHEFILGDRTVQIAHEHGTQAYHAPSPGVMTVPAGQTRVTTYTFDAPGPLIIGCHLPGHYAYGMRAPVSVV